MKQLFFQILIKLITVTEVRISPDFKYAKVFFIPLIGQKKDKYLEELNNFSRRLNLKHQKTGQLSLYQI